MSVLKLRTLTRKSVVGFGRFATATVQQLLDRKNKAYLFWIYCNCSNITFDEEILVELNIWEERRIPKPGKNPELYDPEIGRLKNTLKNFKVRAHDQKEVKIIRRLKQRGNENRWFSKGANAWKNQGH